MHRILLAAACARAAAANATRAGALRNGTAGAKIFGVGFKKTATESLLSAYDALGLGVACGEACRADAARVLPFCHTFVALYCLVFLTPANLAFEIFLFFPYLAAPFLPFFHSLR